MEPAAFLHKEKEVTQVTGKTHIICGTTTMLLMTVLNPTGMTLGGQNFLPVVGMISVAAGSCTPDIDIPQSRLGRRFKFISKRLTHRGFTHSLVVPVMLALIMFCLAYFRVPIIPDLLLGFEVGYLAHIIADSCNKKGTPLLWPISSKHFHFASVLTGSNQEATFLGMWVGGHISWAISQLTQVIALHGGLS